jgi:hypothetical protein
MGRGMTLAVCVKCGSIKFGALTRCDECGLRPETEVDIAYSLAFSDHYLSGGALKTLSQQVLQGASLPSQIKSSCSSLRREDISNSSEL